MKTVDEILWTYLGEELELYMAFPAPPKCPTVGDAKQLEAHAILVATQIERTLATTVRPGKVWRFS